jgi:hypothetical protein
MFDYVTGENYAMMLDFFLPQLRRCSLHTEWFQQDGARPHHSRGPGIPAL